RALRREREMWLVGTFPWILVCFKERKGKCKTGSMTGRTLNSERIPMSLDDSSANIESQSAGWTPALASPLARCDRLARAIGSWSVHGGEGAEACEQGRQLFFGHAGTAICHPQLYTDQLLICFICEY